MFQTHLIWRAAVRNGPPRTVDSIRNILQNFDDLTEEQRKGILGPSPLMDYPGFNFILGIPCDYMHAICLGVTKRLIELTFSSSSPARKRVTKRKLSSPEQYNSLIAQVLNTVGRSHRYMYLVIYFSLHRLRFPVNFPGE